MVVTLTTVRLYNHSIAIVMNSRFGQTFEDCDWDGIPNGYDLDSDNDGIPDALEYDYDRDGKPGDDCDGDGIQTTAIQIYVNSSFLR